MGHKLYLLKTQSSCSAITNISSSELHCRTISAIIAQISFNLKLPSTYSFTHVNTQHLKLHSWHPYLPLVVPITDSSWTCHTANSTLSEILDKRIPVKSKRVGSSPFHPWNNSDIKKDAQPAWGVCNNPIYLSISLNSGTRCRVSVNSFQQLNPSTCCIWYLKAPPLKPYYGKWWIRSYTVKIAKYYQPRPIQLFPCQWIVSILFWQDTDHKTSFPTFPPLMAYLTFNLRHRFLAYYIQQHSPRCIIS